MGLHTGATGRVVVARALVYPGAVNDLSLHAAAGRIAGLPARRRAMLGAYLSPAAGLLS